MLALTGITLAATQRCAYCVSYERTLEILM